MVGNDVAFLLTLAPLYSFGLEKTAVQVPSPWIWGSKGDVDCNMLASLRGLA